MKCKTNNSQSLNKSEKAKFLNYFPLFNHKAAQNLTLSQTCSSEDTSSSKILLFLSSQIAQTIP